ncbi:glycoside hydrolase family 3 C-terminal domain-containing protein [Emcibacter sp. SYSU 3D8]|uniref:glycoside hydrolase family 3 C-terminal domain-containing protein n=1 Tax=Emcibacter sp. SYSU 3D8 TaxID=3133969 RepID=UPI0031FE7B78
MSDPAATLDSRVEDLLRKLTLEEKAALLAGADGWTTVAIPRVGLPSIRMADGPNGYRSTQSEPSTAFPVGVAMGATWNPARVREAAAAMAREARASGVNILLGPNINIQRTPLGGRNFETYSEDPVLSGELALAFVEGVQGEGVGVSVKHFAANNQEHERLRGSSNVSERALREIYFPAFEKAVKQGDAWTVMAAYNRVNGIHASEHPWLLNQVLKREWGFGGVVISDWGATHSSAAVAAGLDMEMPGPAMHFGQRLVEAVGDGAVPSGAVDEAARRMLRLILRALHAGGQAEINTERHARIARSVAEEAVVLLKNDGILPLGAGRLGTIAVIGPNADEPIIQGSGSAHVIPFREVTPLDGLRALLGDRAALVHAPGTDNEPQVPLIDRRMLSPDRERTQQGLMATYYGNADFEGPAVREAVEPYLHKFGFHDAAAPIGRGAFSVRWQGWLWPERGGDYDFIVECSHRSDTWAEIRIDGVPVAGRSTEQEAFAHFEVVRMKRGKGRVRLEAGRAYRIEIDYSTRSDLMRIFKVGARKPAGTIEDAVAAASGADIALVFVGVSRSTDGEGFDRPDMELWGDQNALVEAVAAANPNIVVILQNGAPVTMPWLDKARALMTAWLPGQEGGHAVARVLAGEVNPSGRLPHTMPRRLEDNPTFVHYPGGRDAEYGEGVFVGYRYYDKAKIEPLFPFGFGLSYTTFGYAVPRGPEAVRQGDTFTVSVDVTNLGDRPGQEVVQLYIEQAAPTEARPLRELKGFRKVALAPGETRTVDFTVTPRDLSFYDVHLPGWRAEPGRFAAHFGGSSRDLPARHDFDLIEHAPEASSAA